MQQVIVHRPVTVQHLAEALGMQPFQVIAELIKRAVFLAPDQEVEDAAAYIAAADVGVELIIREDDEGGEGRPSAEPPPKPGVDPSGGNKDGGIPYWRANLPGLPPGSSESPPRNPAGPDPDTLSPDEE